MSPEKPSFQGPALPRPLKPGAGLIEKIFLRKPKGGEKYKIPEKGEREKREA
jgi:hypothetical protein